MRIQIVNESDELIGIKDINDRRPNDIYRVSSLWITNSIGDILLARRAWHKHDDPGMWGVAVAGTLEEGEEYESNIIKEAEEELGLKNIQPMKGLKLRKNNFFVQRFSIVLDVKLSDLHIQESEVAEVKWFTREELKNELQNNPNDFLKGIHERMKLL